MWQHLGMTFNEWLDSTGVKQAFIARRLEVSPALVHRWKSGERAPSAEQIVTLEEFTGGAVTVRDWAETERLVAEKRKASA